MNDFDAGDVRLAAFLSRGGWPASTLVSPLPGGKRHRVYLLRDDSRSAVLKLYGSPGIAAREPFEHESLVHQFFARHCPASVPRILNADPATRGILFEWVKGDRPAAAQIDRAAMSQMAKFITALNTLNVREDARRVGIPDASDAAFDFAGHLNQTQLRLEQLVALCGGEATLANMKRFVETKLMPAFRDLRVSNDRRLGLWERALSPSDFGFHNVLVAPENRWVFLDFEHAGWDDPAKLAADFFLQPECPLGADLRGEFIDELRQAKVFDDAFPSRVNLLLPLQAIKWTAVILNVFQFEQSEGAAPMLNARLAKAEKYWECCRSQFLRMHL